jgi:hypothetical protein
MHTLPALRDPQWPVFGVIHWTILHKLHTERSLWPVFWVIYWTILHELHTERSLWPVFLVIHWTILHELHTERSLWPVFWVIHWTILHELHTERSLSGVETPTSFAKSPKPAHSFCTIYNKFPITKPDHCRILKFPSFGGVSAAQFFVKMEKYTKRLTGWFRHHLHHFKLKPSSWKSINPQNRVQTMNPKHQIWDSMHTLPALRDPQW